jgi:hypothetical protein
MPEILTPRCPLCGQYPFMVMGGGTQAFCDTPACEVLIWNPARSIDQNLLEACFVSLTEREG